MGITLCNSYIIYDNTFTKRSGSNMVSNKLDRPTNEFALLSDFQFFNQ